MRSASALSASVGTVPFRCTTPFSVSTCTLTRFLALSAVSLAFTLVVMAASSTLVPIEVSAADATWIGPARSARTTTALSRDLIMIVPSRVCGGLQAAGPRLRERRRARRHWATGPRVCALRPRAAEEHARLVGAVGLGEDREGVRPQRGQAHVVAEEEPAGDR